MFLDLGGVDGLAALDRFLANVGTDATLRAATGAVSAAEAPPIAQDGDGFGSAASARPAALAAAFVFGGAILALLA